MNAKRITTLVLMALFLCLPMLAMADEETFTMVLKDVSVENNLFEQGSVLLLAENGEYMDLTSVLKEAIENEAELDGIGLPLFALFDDEPNVIMVLEGENTFSGKKIGIKAHNSSITIEGEGSLYCSGEQSGILNTYYEDEADICFLHIRSGRLTVESEQHALRAYDADEESELKGEYTFSNDLDLVESSDKKLVITDEHTWSEATSNGNGTHTLVCKYNAGHKGETVSCSGGVATTTQLAVCEYCSAEYGELLPVPPQTGDESNVFLWSVLACMSLFGTMTLVSKRKEA